MLSKNIRWLVILSVIFATTYPIKIFRPTTFDLYTQPYSSPQRLDPNDPFTFLNSSFNQCLKTALLVTGMAQPDNHPLIILAANFITQKNYNVIVVNYMTGVIWYPVITFWAGRRIGDFLSALNVTLNYDLDNMILIGASLGAHITAFAAKLMPSIGRIIGLDPSGPLYDLVPKSYRLSKDDAKFVDVIHTSQIYGTTKIFVGHANFILNGGIFQPGCSVFDLYCVHVRATLVFLSSIGVCRFKFTRCFSYFAYRLGLCRNQPSVDYGLGMDIDSMPRDGQRYFHNVAFTDFPYCDPFTWKMPNFTGQVC